MSFLFRSQFHKLERSCTDLCLFFCSTRKAILFILEKEYIEIIEAGSEMVQNINILTTLTHTRWPILRSIKFTTNKDKPKYRRKGTPLTKKGNNKLTTNHSRQQEEEAHKKGALPGHKSSLFTACINRLKYPKYAQKVRFAFLISHYNRFKNPTPVYKN